MAVFDGNVVLVVEDRVNGPLDLADTSVAACSERTMTLQEALKVQQAQRLLGFMDTPPAVDLSKTDIKPGSRTVAVVTATGGTTWPEPLDRSALPACAGQPPAS